MKIKEVQAGVKIVKNYNSYQVSLVADVESGESPEDVGDALIEKASKMVVKNAISAGDGLVEVGAAWKSKKIDKALSVNMKDGKWEDVLLEELKKDGKNYVMENFDERLIFREIPKEKRTNEKMPIYRIYKEVKNE